MIPPILLDPYLVSPERLSKVSREARLLFLLLGNEVDHFGGFDADPEALAAKLYPSDEGVDGLVVTRWLDQLRDKEFIATTAGDTPDSCIVGWLHAVDAVRVGA